MRAALVKGPLEAAFTRPRLRRPAVLRLLTDTYKLFVFNATD